MTYKIRKMINNGTEYKLGSIDSSNETYENIIHLSQEEYDALETKDPDTLYSTPESESPGTFSPENSGAIGDILKKTETGYRRDPLACGGEEGQVLTRTENGYEWCNVSTAPGYGYIDLLVVGGGGAGGGSCSGSKGGGGGGGGVIYCEHYPLNFCTSCTKIIVGVGGTGSKCYAGGNGGDSCFGVETAKGGGGGQGGTSLQPGCTGGSGGGGGGSNQWVCYSPSSSCIQGQGNAGGGGRHNTSGCYAGGGGGGAGSAGVQGDAFGKGGNGGSGFCTDISGACIGYAGGGGAPGNVSSGTGRDGGGNAESAATWYGGGGGGCGAGYGVGGNGYQGVVILRYHTDGSDNILPSSTGGCKYDCGDYTIHCFTTTGLNNYFVPVFK